MSRITVSTFNSSDPDSIEPMECLEIVIASPEKVISGVTDRSGRFQAQLTPGDYFFHVLDGALFPSSGKGIPYLLDYPIKIEFDKELFVRVVIDSSLVESETDIPKKLKLDVALVIKDMI